MEQEYEGTELPSEVTRAQVMLREHESNRDRMNQLIGLSHNEGEQIVVRVRQKVSDSSVFPETMYQESILTVKDIEWQRMYFLGIINRNRCWKCFKINGKFVICRYLMTVLGVMKISCWKNNLKIKRRNRFLLAIYIYITISLSPSSVPWLL